MRQKQLISIHILLRSYTVCKLNSEKTSVILLIISIQYTHHDLMKLMRSLNPPLGWGKLCIQGLVYWVYTLTLSLTLSLTTPPFSLIDLIFIQKMMQLNIPLNDDGTIDFNSTLLGIVCQALCIETQGNRKQLRRK